MKGLKLSGLAGPVTDFVQKLRLDEIKVGTRSRFYSLATVFVSFTPILMAPVVTFGAAPRRLDAAQMFTGLSYLMLLSGPLLTLFMSAPRIATSLACLGRIQAFLASVDREDLREVVNSIAGLSEKVSGPHDDSDPAIVVMDGQFGWTQDKVALRDINIQVPRSCLTLVVGPIASGKSTLTKALLGEAPVSHGSVHVRTKFPRVGFCDQVFKQGFPV
jgi:ABC-type multidrug transport system fused ATPase/permease subunit